MSQRGLITAQHYLTINTRTAMQACPQHGVVVAGRKAHMLRAKCLLFFSPNFGWRSWWLSASVCKMTPVLVDVNPKCSNHLQTCDLTLATSRSTTMYPTHPEASSVSARILKLPSTSSGTSSPLVGRNPKSAWISVSNNPSLRRPCWNTDFPCAQIVHLGSNGVWPCILCFCKQTSETKFNSLWTSFTAKANPSSSRDSWIEQMGAPPPYRVKFAGLTPSHWMKGSFRLPSTYSSGPCCPPHRWEPGSHSSTLGSLQTKRGFLPRFQPGRGHWHPKFDTPSLS